MIGIELLYWEELKLREEGLLYCYMQSFPRYHRARLTDAQELKLKKEGSAMIGGTLPTQGQTGADIISTRQHQQNPLILPAKEGLPLPRSLHEAWPSKVWPLSTRRLA